MRQNMDPSSRLAMLVGAYPLGKHIENAIERYLGMVAESMPTLAMHEWLLICDSLNGVSFADSSHLKNRIIANIADSICNEALDRKWGINSENLLASIQTWTNGQAISVLHVAETFWNHLEMSHEESLIMAGAKFR